MNKVFFLSHSSEDRKKVEAVANRLGRDRCWLSEWEVRPGDSIFGFDKGIADSRIFVLFWSFNASQSHWVEDEVSQARIRASRDKGFRLVTIRLDGTTLPPALEYRQWIDGTKGINQIVNALTGVETDLTPEEALVGKSILKDSFQDRENELELMEKVAFGNESAIMILGLDGIGKTSLVKRATAKLFAHLTPIWVDLEVASTPIRLLSSIAKPLSIIINPNESVSNPEQLWSTRLLPEIAESDNLFIVLDNLVVDKVSGNPSGMAMQSLVETICSDLADVDRQDNPGLILISRTEPDLNDSTMSKFKVIRLGALEKKYIIRALRFQLGRSGLQRYDSNKLQQLADAIEGYPAAINLVAQRVVEGGIDTTIADTSGVSKIRRHLAQHLLSRIPLTQEEIELLILLATATYPLSERQLIIVWGKDLSTANTLTRKQLLDPTQEGFFLHSILREYVSESMATPNSIIEYHHRLSSFFHNEWRRAPFMSASRAQYASLTHYHALSSGRRRLARLIGADYLVEAKQAAVELYRRGKYETALLYLETAKSIDGKADPFFDFYYALSLNRRGRNEEALDILKKLVGQFPKVSRYNHALGTVYRALDENDKAIESYRQAISLANEQGKITPLSSLADLLCDIRRPDEALPIIQQALDIDPTKAFTVATASRVLDDTGDTKSALDLVLGALRVSPTNARLHHRAGMILKKIGNLTEARDHLQIALDEPALAYSVIALADVYLQLGEVDKAEEVLENFSGNKKRSSRYLSTKANILRHKANLKDAEALLMRAISIEPWNTVIKGGIAQVKIDKANEFIMAGNRQSAIIAIKEAENWLSEALEKEPKEETLLSTKNSLDKLKLQIGS